MKNLYPGVNPHFNSRLQSPNGGWESFHAEMIARMANWLEAALPKSYYPLIERSMQIGQLTAEVGAPLAAVRRTRPDVIVFRRKHDDGVGMVASGPAPTMTLPIVDSFDDEADISGVVIYRVAGAGGRGIPITRIELLSRANKPGASYYDEYLSLRRQTLFSGLRLVEIDLLHETRPLLARMPSYLDGDGDADAYPYHVLVSDPRPTPEEGETRIYGFGVANAIPQVVVPLDGTDAIAVNFGEIYNVALEGRRGFDEMIEYDQRPDRFETYAPADQDFILRRMAEIAADQRGRE